MPEFHESDHPRDEEGKFTAEGAAIAVKALHGENFGQESGNSYSELKWNEFRQKHPEFSGIKTKEIRKHLDKKESPEQADARKQAIAAEESEMEAAEISWQLQQRSFGPYTTRSRESDLKKVLNQLDNAGIKYETGNSSVSRGSVYIHLQDDRGLPTGATIRIADHVQKREYNRSQKAMVPRGGYDPQTAEYHDATSFSLDPSNRDLEGTVNRAIAHRETDDVAMDGTMRTFTADGRMHIARSHISKACVNPYFGREIPGYQDLGLIADKTYYLLRSPEELAKAADTFRILPILNKHVAVGDFDGMDEQQKKKYIVGAVGSDVEFLAPYLDADVCIWEANAIAGIETDTVREFSCAYRYVPVMTIGEYEGQKFDGIMTQLHGNHLALVESGRAGNDVLASDSKQEKPPMKRSKLGNALAIALETAFPKVKVTADSALEKAIGGATRKTFGTPERKAALELVLAMDAELDGKKVTAVMDALADVEDPVPSKKDNEGAEDDEGEHVKGCMCQDCKSARDEEPEDEPKKPAKDKKSAKDAEPVDKKEMKGAMDALEGKLKAQFMEADEAKRDVRPVVGDVIAMDSAADIYAFALDHLKVEREGVEGVPALKALFKLAASKNVAKVPAIAMDSAATHKRFPHMSRFGHA